MMKIVVDSREQAPFTFQHERYEVMVEVGALTHDEGAPRLCHREGDEGGSHE